MTGKWIVGFVGFVFIVLQIPSCADYLENDSSNGGPCLSETWKFHTSLLEISIPLREIIIEARHLISRLRISFAYKTSCACLSPILSAPTLLDTRRFLDVVADTTPLMGPPL